jgi:hypothetical protein
VHKAASDVTGIGQNSIRVNITIVGLKRAIKRIKVFVRLLFDALVVIELILLVVLVILKVLIFLNQFNSTGASKSIELKSQRTFNRLN